MEHRITFTLCFGSILMVTNYRYKTLPALCRCMYLILGLERHRLAPCLQFWCRRWQDSVQLRQEAPAWQRPKWDEQSSPCFCRCSRMRCRRRQWKRPRLLVQPQSAVAASWACQQWSKWLWALAALPGVDRTSIWSSVCWHKWWIYFRVSCYAQVSCCSAHIGQRHYCLLIAWHLFTVIFNFCHFLKTNIVMIAWCVWIVLCPIACVLHWSLLMLFIWKNFELVRVYSIYYFSSCRFWRSFVADCNNTRAR